MVIDELRSTRAQLAAVERAHGVQDERSRLSREIHDTLAQGFTSVIALSRAASSALERDDVDKARERLAMIESTAVDNLAEARVIVAELTPGHLQSRTLVEALARLADTMTRETGIQVSSSVAGEPAPLGGNAEVVVLRCAQEALSNVRRHSGAQTAAVTLAYEAERVALEVIDDGSGFDPATRQRVRPRRIAFSRNRTRRRRHHRSRNTERHPTRHGAAPMIRILVVDDHPVVRAGMVALLSELEDLDVVGEAGNGAEALALSPKLAPDVVLMDLRMPVMDGAEATARLRAQPDPPEVLVLTTYDTDADIVRAVESGARGYLLKDTPPAVLADAIRRAALGETVLAPPVAARLAERLRAPAQVELTPRELDVLRAVARGLSNGEVGRELFIGEATVKTHLLRIFSKLEVTDRTAAVTAAYKVGLITLPRN